MPNTPLTEDEVLCPWCGERTHNDDMVTDPTGTEEICTGCNDDIELATCEWCEDTGPADSMFEGDVVLCSDCHSHSFGCDDCASTTHIDDSNTVGNWRRERTVCTDCREGDYFYCEGCDESLPMDDYGSDGYCNECEEDDEDECDCDECGANRLERGGNGIRRWGDLPDLKFHDVPFIGPQVGQATYGDSQRSYNWQPKPNTYYLGMEIELSHVSSHVVGDFVTEHEDMMWATTDATIDSGYEVVTMPITYDAWMSEFPWREWTEDIHDVVPNQEDHSDTGIHIHISRAAFYNHRGKPMASHLYKFMQFIRINEGAVMMLAGRGTNSYCRWDQQRDARDSMNDAKASTSQRNYERYRPINTQNPQTIELRFFDGRSDPTFMKRALQFVHSVAEFTRGGNLKDSRAWETYTEWVRDRRDYYPELAQFFNVNKRRLLMNALTTEHAYKDVVLPRLKQDKIRQLEEARIERERRAQAVIERQRIMDTMDDPCTCDVCNGVNGIVDTCEPASAGSTIVNPDPTREGYLRSYVDGNFIVHVYQTQMGQRHEYAHVGGSSDMTGEYTMANPEVGYTDDVVRNVYNRDTNSYIDITLRRN